MVEINASAQYQTQAENDKSARQILRKNLSVPESMIQYHFLPKQILIYRSKLPYFSHEKYWHRWLITNVTSQSNNGFAVIPH